MIAKKILVIEDNPVNMELVTDLLEAHGFEFVTAMNAEDGIRLAEAESPQLVLMDIQLPGMDGLQATEHLKRNPKTHHIPVVALTAHAMKGDEDRALEVGCVGYITKPINTRAFPRLVAEFSEQFVDPFAAVASSVSREPLEVEPVALEFMALETEPVTIDATLRDATLRDALAADTDVDHAPSALEPVELELEPVELELEPVALELETVALEVAALEVVAGDALEPSAETPYLEVVDGDIDIPLEVAAFTFDSEPIGAAPIEVVAAKIDAPATDESLPVDSKSIWDEGAEASSLPSFGVGGRRKRRTLNFAAAPTATARFLVVDDDEINREMLSAMLRTLGYEADLVESGPAALEALDGRHDMILLDYMMPGMDGVEVCRRIREEKRFADLPIVMVTALSSKDDQLRAVESGANDWICKPVDRTELSVRVASLLKMKRAQDALKQHQRDLEETVRARTTDLRKALEEVRTAQETARRAALDAMQRMAFLAEFREGPTAAAHIRATGMYCAAIARGLGLSQETIENLQVASQVHDIGLLSIPDAIVNKKGERDEYEESVLRQHTILGARLLSGSQSELIRAAESIALNHHERWDGTGFPQGLSGDEIPLYGRIFAVADAFDELTAFQHKRRTYTNDEARESLREQAGESLDPKIVDAFLERWEEIEKWQRQFRRTEEPPDDLPVATVSYAL